MARGKKTGGGSRKGSPNKATAELKDMILQALAGAGGTAYLQEQATKNPAAFMTLIGKVLPLQVNAQGQFAGELIIKWQPPAKS